MEFGKRKSTRRRRLLVEGSYSSGLQFYNEPPTGKVSLKEFDEMAFERLKVLRSVERLNLSSHVKNSDEWIARLYEEFVKSKSFITRAEKSSNNKDEVQKARRQDHVSHFILRLAYCRTEELRRWFIAHETDLFKARFIRASKYASDIKHFLETNKLHYAPITAQEKQSERENLVASSMTVTGDNIEGMAFYKVPFIDALELVRQRKVFVKKGFAYVPETALATLVTNSFRVKLSYDMAITYRALPALDSDERLVKLLQDFDKRYTGGDYSSKKRKGDLHITPAMIDGLATKSFPPCMRQLHDSLKTTHHLKFYGRIIYGLFLKAAGLTLEDALHFWRSHFLKNMDADKFDKQYSYGIRYNYGKEGKRTNFSPYGCIKIIMSNIAAGDAHGCPFKHSDAVILRQRLKAYNVPSQAIDEILELARKRHYQVACQRYWEVTHGVAIPAGINHPNQFFEESHKFWNGGVLPTQGKKQQQQQQPEMKTTRSVMYSSQSSQPSQASQPSTSQPSQPSQMSSQPTTSTTTPSEEMDLCIEDDDDMEAAMLEQCAE